MSASRDLELLVQYSPILYAPLVGVTVSVDDLCSTSTRAIKAFQHVCPAAGLHMGKQRAPPHLPPCAKSAGPKPAACLQYIARKAWPCLMQCWPPFESCRKKGLKQCPRAPRCRCVRCHQRISARVSTAISIYVLLSICKEAAHQHCQGLNWVMGQFSQHAASNWLADFVDLPSQFMLSEGPM